MSQAPTPHIIIPEGLTGEAPATSLMCTFVQQLRFTCGSGRGHGGDAIIWPSLSTPVHHHVYPSPCLTSPGLISRVSPVSTFWFGLAG